VIYFWASVGRSLVCVFPQNVGDTIAGQRLAVAVDEDVLLVGAHRRAAQSMQDFGGLAPQWQQALLSALAVKPHLPR
jgi:hypothetical protein